MWTAGLHGGARLSMSTTSVVTPYLNYDYVHAKLDGFTETGLPGANLSVEGGRSNHSFLTGGAKWATQMGGVVPEVNLGYRYRFGDRRSQFGALFNGDEDCDFDIVSAAQKKGTFLAGLSVGGKVGPVDLRIGYEGEFNGDVTSHSGSFKLVLPLGGHAAPPPPPPVAAPPPPPPPAVEQPAPPPPPPPPPPAPVERGERGQ
jgi:trimeric autotransporter adhesin